MKKTFLILVAFAGLITTSCSNEVRKETVNDTTKVDSMDKDTTVVDTTKMPPDTTKQN